MRGYGQFCPISATAEVLTERWTPLVVRELWCGSTRFNEIGRGVPQMSPSVLSARLKSLEHAGVLQRCDTDDGIEYLLTEAGQELGPILLSMGKWGQRWVRGDANPDNLDASLLVWDMHRNVIAEHLPDRRVVVSFRLDGSIDQRRHFWLVLEPDAVDVCLSDPGFEGDLHVNAHVASMVAYWMGSANWNELVRSGSIELEGRPTMVRAFPTWFTRSALADVPLARTSDRPAARND
jgi:DNA-binding HxlR family transcriptional regulator